MSKTAEGKAALAEWCRTFVRFMAEKGALTKAHQRRMEKAIVVAEEKSNVGGLRALQREFRQHFIARLPAKEKAEVEELLSGQSGPADSDIEKEISRIIGRGVAETEDEYRMLNDRVEAIWQDPSKNAEKQAINRILQNSYKKFEEQ